MNKNNKVLLIVVLVLFLVITLLYVSYKNLRQEEPESKSAFQEAQIIDEEYDPASDAEEVGTLLEDPVLVDLLASSREEAVGASLITSDNRVINREGQEVKTNVSVSDSSAPTQTGPIDQSDLSENSITINVVLGEFSPNEFRVRAGQPVTLALKSNDVNHNLVFEDAVLSAVALAVGPNELRAVTFKAPDPGHYPFYCNIGGSRIGHASRGETGVMIVE